MRDSIKGPSGSEVVPSEQATGSNDPFGSAESSGKRARLVQFLQEETKADYQPEDEEFDAQLWDTAMEGWSGEEVLKGDVKELTR